MTRVDGLEAVSVGMSSDATDPRVEVTRPGAALVVLAIGLVTFVSLVVPMLVSAHYGALGAARGDDWSYLRTLFTWVDGHGLNFNHWVSMTLLGQLVLAAPVAWVRADDIAAAQTLVAIVGCVGLGAVMYATQVVTRRLGTAVLITLVIALGPLWGGLAVTFMTDIPGFAAAMVALAIGLTAFRDGDVSVARVAACVGAGFVAFTIREYAVVPAAAVVLVGARQLLRRGENGRARTVVLVALGGVVAALGVALVWRAAPDGRAFLPSLPTTHAIKNATYKIAGMSRLLGLWVTPVVLWIRPDRVVRRAWSVSRDATVVGTGLVATWLAFTAVSSPRIAFAGNYVQPRGFLGDAVNSGHRPDLIPVPLFDALIVVGTVSAVLLYLAAVPALVRRMRVTLHREHARHDDPITQVLAVATSLYGVGYTAAAVFGLPLFDRYVLPVVPMVALLLARVRARRLRGDAASGIGPAARNTRAAVVALVALAALSWGFMVDSASFDGARWQVAEAATRLGWTPRQIGGNWEWVNYHSRFPGIRRMLPTCVLVVVHPTAKQSQAIIAARTYHAPLHRSVKVAAITTRSGCRPRGPAPAPASGR